MKSEFETPVIFFGPDKKAIYEYVKNIIRDLFREEGAYALLKLEKGIHPDVIEFFPEGKMVQYTMEVIQGFLKDVVLSPYESRIKVYLFHDAHKMMDIHANTLLKTLEEKPLYARIFLLTDDLRALLETVQSRCKKFYVNKKGDVDSALFKEELEAMFKLAKEKEYASLIEMIEKVEEKHKESLDEDAFDDLCATYLSLQRESIDLENALSVIEKVQLGFKRRIRLKYLLEYLIFKADDFFVASN